MLLQDMLEFGKGNEDTDRQIMNKYKAEMVYYLVIEAIVEKYGTVDANTMQSLHIDALCCARDQMAMFASDQGLVHYNTDGRIYNLSQPSLQKLVVESFKNSEALRAVVSTNLASNRYKNVEMTDDELFAAVDKEFESIVNLNDENSLASKVWSKVQTFDDVMYGKNVSNLYATKMRAEKISMIETKEKTIIDNTKNGKEEIDQLKKVAKKEYTDEVINVLKISPLTPEIKMLRKAAGGQLGLVDVDKNTGYGNDKLILMFDAQKRLLIKADSDFDSYHNTKDGKEFNRGLIIGQSEYGDAIKYTYTDISVNDGTYGDDDISKNAVATVIRNEKIVNAYGENKTNNDLNTLFKWRMLELLNTYSQQNLNERDIETIGQIFDRSGATLFGDVNKDGLDEVLKNADAYFEYIEHVCETVRTKMSSHEFEIHFEHSKYLEGSDGLVPLMYFTGERTQEYNRARSNNARFFGIYPYMDYLPSNLDVCPAIGDVAPASYNTYIVTNDSMHHDPMNPIINDNKTNPYMHVKKITPDMIEKMRKTFDAYMDPSKNQTGIEIRKIQRNVGRSDVADISKFIRDDHTVDADAIISCLIDDMNAIKMEQRTNFHKIENARHFENIVQRFIDKQMRNVSRDNADINDDLIADQSSYSMAAAMEQFITNMPNDITYDALKIQLQKELSTHMVHELRGSYGEDIDSFVIYKHAFNNYIRVYTDDLIQSIMDDKQLSDVVKKDVYSIPFNAVNQMTDKITQKIVSQNDEVFERSLDELFGKGEQITKNGNIDKRYTNQCIIIKPNMCKHASKRFMYDDYDNMLRLLSYTDAALYESQVNKKTDAVMENMRENNARFAVQLYVANVYNSFDVESNSEIVDQDGEEIENTTESENQEYNAAFDDIMWYTSTFAKIDNIGDKSYEWLTSNHLSEEEEKERVIFIATHPLQYEALRKTHNVMRDMNRSHYSADRLKITESGILYYKNEDNNLEFKIGPIIEERAYIRPYIEEDENGELEIERVKRYSDGTPYTDDHGKSITEKVRVNIVNDIVIKNGRLQNEVVFGALDTPSLTGDKNTIPNRFYGVSAKIKDYNGYDHNHQSFVERMEFHTYQSSVLDMLDKNLALYRISKHNEMNNQIPQSILYTNVCASSLQKCYRTNTYIMHNKAKCKMADWYMSHCLTGDQYDVLGDAKDDLMVRKELEKVSSLVMMQSDVFRKRVVMPKIALEQNIGLYNQVLNLQQCSTDVVLGEIDRKNMRNSDNKSMRVAVFAPNKMFDPVLSGTAKQLGAVGFLTESVIFDPISCRYRVNPNATTESRCKLTGTGVIDFATDHLICRMTNYPGGQAVDRMQLSSNAIEQSLNFATDIKFAMYNAGYNMEDGYVVAERSVAKLGHFDENGVYHSLEQWDKIGDTESGNKGVTAKIVRTSIGEGMSDAEANDAFLEDFAYRELLLYRFNYQNRNDSNLSKEFMEQLDNAACSCYPYIGGNTFEEKIDNLTVYETGETIGVLRKQRDELLLRDVNHVVNMTQIEKEERLKEINEKIDKTIRPYYKTIGQNLIDYKVEPFYGHYELEHNLWQLFRDNPDLDLAITNVCVLTRSNPSLLMYVADALEQDLDSNIDLSVFDVSHPEEAASVLIKRNEKGEKVAYLGAKGSYNIYVDSHTSEDKQRDYTEMSNKNGRKFGSQEMYALQAKHCNNAFIKFVTMNDPTLSERIEKLNRKLMMNGFILDSMSQPVAYQANKLEELLSNLIIEPNDDKNDETTYVSNMLPGYGFVDMDQLANKIVENIRGNIKAQDYSKIVKNISEDLAFGQLFFHIKDDNTVTNNLNAEDILKHMFVVSFGQYGGNFMLLPESIEDSMLLVSHATNTKEKDVEYDDYYVNGDENEIRGYDNWKNNNETKKAKTYSVKSDVIIRDVDGHEAHKKATPLFLAAQETLNSESETVTSKMDDRLQFDIFKTVIGSAVIEKLYQQEKINTDEYHKCQQKLSEKLQSQYADVTSGRYKSLKLDDMRNWLKKNIYTIVFPNSLTTVWSGNPTLELDEVGISFEKAKNLGLLRPRKDIDVKLIPDDYEHIYDRYEPLREDDYVLINRSPGQTTGCIRAMHPKIVCAHGDGLEIHPACATIFDGDFDGDTVGVNNPFKCNIMCMTPEMKVEFYRNLKNAKKELGMTMTMESNLVHTADYTTIKTANGHEIEFVNPLFIEGKADIAIAKRAMMKPDENGNPSCGYDVNKELDRITVMANMIEQYKQFYYDGVNMKENPYLNGYDQQVDDLMSVRIDKIEELHKFFEEDSCDPKWKKLVANFDQLLRNDIDDTFLDKIHELEIANKNNLTSLYRDMTGYMMKDSLFTHGNTHYEMLSNIIRDANISKKGKEPQLNALLIFSGTHAKCGGDLIVAKDKETSNFEVRLSTNEHPEGVKIDMSDEEQIALKTVMDYRKAKSDVPLNNHKTQIESNITAQSDKSDATGLGGAVAQKMQKIFSIMGYGELGLRISGPITQIFLDAKQNVTKCEKNLKLGKFVLDRVCNFNYVDELSDGFMKDTCPSQVYNGQFTNKSYVMQKKVVGSKEQMVPVMNANGEPVRAAKYMTLDECVSQLNNFLKVMGQPEFSDRDKAIVKLCLSPYLENKNGELCVVKPMEKVDEIGDQSYASMYPSGSKLYSDQMQKMVERGQGIWYGSYAYGDRHINTEFLNHVKQEVFNKNCMNIGRNCENVVKRQMPLREDKTPVRNHNYNTVQGVEQKPVQTVSSGFKLPSLGGVTSVSEKDASTSVGGQVFENPAEVIRECTNNIKNRCNEAEKKAKIKIQRDESDNLDNEGPKLPGE